MTDESSCATPCQCVTGFIVNNDRVANGDGSDESIVTSRPSLRDLSLNARVLCTPTLSDTIPPLHPIRGRYLVWEACRKPITSHPGQLSLVDALSTSRRAVMFCHWEVNAGWQVKLCDPLVITGSASKMSSCMIKRYTNRCYFIYFTLL